MTFNQVAKRAAVAIPLGLAIALPATAEEIASINPSDGTYDQGYDDGYNDAENAGVSIESAVGANQNLEFFHYFEENEPYDISLTGFCDKPRQDIDLWIYGEHGGRELAKSTDNSCDDYIFFVPPWDGEYKIVVENKRKPHRTRFMLDMTPR